MSAVRIDKPAAAEALRNAALTVSDPEAQDYGRCLVHCFVGAIGAAWDLDDALTYLGKASDVAWVPNVFDHELAVIVDGKQYNFNARRPEAGS